MSLDYTFFAETRRTGVWTSPSGIDWKGYSSQRFSSFAWLRARAPAVGLFFGEAALLPFRKGVPEDRAGSAMFRYLDTFYDYSSNEYRISWIPYADLLVDLWDEPSLLLETKAHALIAGLFTDGRSPFPERELLERGWPSEAVDALRRGRATRLTRQPRDRVYGLGRFELESADAKLSLPVTWKASISDVLGAECSAAFRRLRDYGPDEELRVISWYS